MYEDLRNAVEVLKEYCISHPCIDCPLKMAACNLAVDAPIAYSLERFDENVKELESGAEYD